MSKFTDKPRQRITLLAQAAPDGLMRMERASDYLNAYCIYEHIVLEPFTAEFQTIYVGCCALSQVYRFPDARRNAKWHDVVDMDKQLYMRILYTGERGACLQKLWHIVAQYNPRPICNAHAMQIDALRKLRCSNGKTYSTQAEAAADLGISQGNISRHLNGEISSVNGYKFWREA